MVTVSPGFTTIAGPGELTVVEVRPQPAGARIRPNRLSETFALALGTVGRTKMPEIMVMVITKITRDILGELVCESP